MKTFKQFLVEDMPDITKGDEGRIETPSGLLRDLSYDQVKENIVMLRQAKDGGFITKGTTFVYFMDTPENAKKMEEGKIPYLIVPEGTFSRGGNPISDVWSDEFAKPGTEHILGLIQGYSDEENISLEMASVRHDPERGTDNPKLDDPDVNEYRRNQIAKNMVRAITERFPNAKITHSSTTNQGAKLMKSVLGKSDEPPAIKLKLRIDRSVQWTGDDENENI